MVSEMKRIPMFPSTTCFIARLNRNNFCGLKGSEEKKEKSDTAEESEIIII
jgi:hypothetical protein